MWWVSCTAVATRLVKLAPTHVFWRTAGKSLACHSTARKAFSNNTGRDFLGTVQPTNHEALFNLPLYLIHHKLTDVWRYLLSSQALPGAFKLPRQSVIKLTAGGQWLPLVLSQKWNASSFWRHLAPPNSPLLGIMRASLFAGSFWSS